MYKQIIKNVIDNQKYELEKMLAKITVMYAEDRITEAEKEELDRLAREKAKPENSYDLQKQINNIFERLEVLENKVKITVENQNEATEPTETDEGYQEYKKPINSRDSYQKGNKVNFQGKIYQCIIDNCPWSPEINPQAWQLIEETIETIKEVVGGEE